MLHIFKRLVFIFVILLVTGCTAEYNITINDVKDIKESLDIIETDKTKFDEKNEQLYNSTLREYLNTNLKWPTPVFNDSEENPLEPTKIKGVKYYEKTDISSSLKLGLRYEYGFNDKEYKKSNILNKCYGYDYEIINNVFTFKTTSDFMCFDKYKLLESVNFNLNTTCNVISSDADIKNKNNFIWKITNKEKQINFSIDCSKKKSKIKVPFTIILPIYFILIGIGVVILRLSYKFKNKI